MTKRLLFLMTTLIMTGFWSFSLQAQDDLTVIIDQNFDAFTEGSESAPATTDISGYGGKLRSTLTGWSGSKVYEAGGCLLIGDGGNLQTAYTNMSSGGGNLRVSFRVRSIDDLGGVQVQLGYNSAQTYYINNEWAQISVIMTGGTSYTYLRFTPYLTFNGVLIDDLKVESSQAFVAAPIVEQPIDATGTSFTASWRAITGATGYLLDVYSRDASGQPQYVLQDQEVPTSSYSVRYQVTGLTDGVQYYYRARTVKGDNVSDYSEEIAVVKFIQSLDAPIATDATEVDENGFVANWEPVADATSYKVSLFKQETISQAGDMEMLVEDFAKVTKGTITSTEYGTSMGDYLDNDTQQPGWYGTNIAYAAGYMGLAPYSSNATLITPAINLSNNGGNFQLTLNMASYYSSTPQTGDVLTINVYQDDNVVDEATVTLDGAFKDYTLDLTGGSEMTYIKLVWPEQKLESEYTGHKLFIDDFKVTQHVEAGDQVVAPVGIFPVENVTSCHFEVPLSEKIAYLYQVRAYAPTVISSYPNNYVAEIASGLSNTVLVELVVPSTAVTDVRTTQARVTGTTGAVVVDAPAGTPVTVVDMAGRLLGTAVSNGSVTIPAHTGVVIVKVGNTATKTIVK